MPENMIDFEAQMVQSLTGLLPNSGSQRWKRIKEHRFRARHRAEALRFMGLEAIWVTAYWFPFKAHRQLESRADAVGLPASSSTGSFAAQVK